MFKLKSKKFLALVFLIVVIVIFYNNRKTNKFVPYDDKYSSIGFTELGRKHFFKDMTEEEIEEKFPEIYISIKENLEENIKKGYITYEEKTIVNKDKKN